MPIAFVKYVFVIELLKVLNGKSQRGFIYLNVYMFYFSKKLELVNEVSVSLIQKLYENFHDSVCDKRFYIW